MKIPKNINCSGIYCIKNTIDSRIYIGSAQKLNYRLWNHRHKLVKNIHANKHLQNFVNKYGIEVLYGEILERVEIENLIVREQYYIDTLKPEFNILQIAGSSTGTIMSDEQKLKISQSKKGILQTDETKQKISESMRGVSKSKEHSAKVGLKHKGKTISDEQKKIISESNKGRITTPKLTWEIVNEIRELNKQGIKDKEISLRFGITIAQACNIRNFKSWNNGL